MCAFKMIALFLFAFKALNQTGGKVLFFTEKYCRRKYTNCWNKNKKFGIDFSENI
jgi:hypothetical protein